MKLLRFAVTVLSLIALMRCSSNELWNEHNETPINEIVTITQGKNILNNDVVALNLNDKSVETLYNGIYKGSSYICSADKNKIYYISEGKYVNMLDISSETGVTMNEFLIKTEDEGERTFSSLYIFNDEYVF